MQLWWQNGTQEERCDNWYRYKHALSVPIKQKVINSPRKLGQFQKQKKKTLLLSFSTLFRIVNVTNINLALLWQLRVSRGINEFQLVISFYSLVSLHLFHFVSVSIYFFLFMTGLNKKQNHLNICYFISIKIWRTKIHQIFMKIAWQSI